MLSAHEFQTELETDVSTIKDGTVLDVDFSGDGFLVVTSTGASLGNPDSFDHNRDQYEFKQAICGRLELGQRI